MNRVERIIMKVMKERWVLKVCTSRWTAFWVPWFSRTSFLSKSSTRSAQWSFLSTLFQSSSSISPSMGPTVQQLAHQLFSGKNLERQSDWKKESKKNCGRSKLKLMRTSWDWWTRCWGVWRQIKRRGWKRWMRFWQSLRLLQTMRICLRVNVTCLMSLEEKQRRSKRIWAWSTQF